MDVVEVRPAVQILGTAILAADLAGDAQRHPVGDQWDVDRAFQRAVVKAAISAFDIAARSEEHTSELQSLMRISYAVFCLKKKNNKTINNSYQHKLQQTIQHKNK